MKRKHLINIHLYLAALLTPVLLMIATSGGLYLLDIKGTEAERVIHRGPAAEYNFAATSREASVRAFIAAQDIDLTFEYLRGGDTGFVTRPTSRTYLAFQIEQGELLVTERTPDTIKTLVELHKGHGPLLFKDFQKAMAIGLLIILISGFVLGVTSKGLRTTTLAMSATGTAVFVLLGFL